MLKTVLLFQKEEVPKTPMVFFLQLLVELAEQKQEGITLKHCSFVAETSVVIPICCLFFNRSAQIVDLLKTIQEKRILCDHLLLYYEHYLQVIDKERDLLHASAAVETSLKLLQLLQIVHIEIHCVLREENHNFKTDR